MPKSPSAVLKKKNSEDKVQVPGSDGAVHVKDAPAPPPTQIFSAGDVIMIPISRAQLSKLGKPEGEAVEELGAKVSQYCDEGFATSDPHSIVMTNDHRKEIIRLVGRDFRTGDDVVRAIRKLLSIDLDFLEIGEMDLPEHLLVRLKTRCHNQDKDPETARATRKEVGRRAVIEGLERFTGLR